MKSPRPDDFARALKFSVNVVAGYHHDHLLVQIDDVDRAISALRVLSARHRPSGGSSVSPVDRAHT